MVVRRHVRHRLLRADLEVADLELRQLHLARAQLVVGLAHRVEPPRPARAPRHDQRAHRQRSTPARRRPRVERVAGHAEGRALAARAEPGQAQMHRPHART